MTTRICRVCQQRFVPALEEQSRCNGCRGPSRDVEVVDGYMRRASGEAIGRIAIATGVSEEVIRQLVIDGRLASTPVDHTPPQKCTCPPGESGRCPACRTRLARQLREARAVASRDDGHSGMRARRR
jgi:hypothetical protein